VLNIVHKKKKSKKPTPLLQYPQLQPLSLRPHSSPPSHSTSACFNSCPTQTHTADALLQHTTLGSGQPMTHFRPLISKPCSPIPSHPSSILDCTILFLAALTSSLAIKAAFFVLNSRHVPPYHGLINYIGTKAKCLHVKIFTCTGTVAAGIYQSL
jgi:hypothetical protein